MNYVIYIFSNPALRHVLCFLLITKTPRHHAVQHDQLPSWDLFCWLEFCPTRFSHAATLIVSVFLGGGRLRQFATPLLLPRSRYRVSSLLPNHDRGSNYLLTHTASPKSDLTPVSVTILWLWFETLTSKLLSPMFEKETELAESHKIYRESITNRKDDCKINPHIFKDRTNPYKY